ncbi:hypothetical protein CK203_022428 [Vitis vinifera]|uniref:Uncharacterized protein n=1 Tax=Vitis vinifera TaxID=29760 RepID=A0A438I9K2_VITVI|nr:hypothetical protein CK203_022428 [Vitis vinifera]
MVVGSSCGQSVQGLKFRISLVLQSPTSEQLEQTIRLGFPASTMKLNMKQSWSANDERMARYLVRVPEEEKQAHISEYRLPLYFNRGQPLQEIIWGLHLKYLNDSDAQYVLVELHEGDTENYVKSCDRCQRYTLIPRMPSEVFNPVTSP